MNIHNVKFVFRALLKLLNFHRVLGYGIQTAHKVAKRRIRECKLAWKKLSERALKVKNKQQKGEVLPSVHSCGHYFTYSPCVLALEIWLRAPYPGIGDVARDSDLSTAIWLLSFCTATIGRAWRSVGANERGESSSIPQVLRPARRCQSAPKRNAKLPVRVWWLRAEFRVRDERSVVRCAMPCALTRGAHLTKSNSIPKRARKQWIREVRRGSGVCVLQSIRH